MLRCKNPYHQVPISCSHVYVCECARVFPYLFYNPARSISQSGSNSVAGEEEGKPGDRLRHDPIHYSSAVRERLSIQTYNDLQWTSTVFYHLQVLQGTGIEIQIVFPARKVTGVIVIYQREASDDVKTCHEVFPWLYNAKLDGFTVWVQRHV